jgi:hypothetical protein
VPCSSCNGVGSVRQFHTPTPPPHTHTHHSIANPAYKGIWVAPDIDNPDFKDDDKLYVVKDLKYVGFELWQVSAG